MIQKEEGGSVTAIYSTFGFLVDSSPKGGNERLILKEVRQFPSPERSSRLRPRLDHLPGTLTSKDRVLAPYRGPRALNQAPPPLFCSLTPTPRLSQINLYI